MNNFPAPIVEDLIELSLRDRQIAYFEIDYRGILISQGGELPVFGLMGLKVGLLIDQQVDLFTGLISSESLPIYLPFMETPSGESADIHIFEKENSFWILLMHTGEKRKHHQAIQQGVYDLRLTHNRRTRILNEHLGREVAVRLEQSMENINSTGERRSLTVMFADLRGFTSFSENTPPQDVFEILNTYLNRMISIVLLERGVVDKIIGDEVMAVFGMLDDQQNGPEDAIEAAIHILTSIESLNRERLQTGQTILQLGIGIATGPVSLGVLGSRHRKSLTVIGNHVNLAARLQGQAAGKQLVIDEATYLGTPAKQNQFSPRKVELRGYSQALNIYQLELENLDCLEQRLMQHEENPTLY